jgi:hypothetical protein
MPNKATIFSTLGVFGLAARLRELDDDVKAIEIHVNERTDQARQKALAKLIEESPVRIIDCPGGGVMEGETLIEALIREIREETCGCSFLPLAEFSKPLAFLNPNELTKPADMALWMPIKLIGQPMPSPEALSHPWITRKQFEAEFPFRPVSGLGKLGRTGQMIKAAFEWFEANRNRPEIFS